jgi:hypothetical protein
MVRKVPSGKVRRVGGLLKLHSRTFLQQLIVGEEVKPGKRGAFGLKKVVEALLDFIKRLVGIDKRFQQVGRSDLKDHVGIVCTLVHAVHEELVDLMEALRLGGQLLLYVVGREDVLEVHPRTLARKPLIEDLRE